MPPSNKPTDPYAGIDALHSYRINADISQADAALLRGLSPTRGNIQLTVNNLVSSFCRNLRSNNVTSYLEYDRFVELLHQFCGANVILGQPVIGFDGSSTARTESGGAALPHNPVARIAKVATDVAGSAKPRSTGAGTRSRKAKESKNTGKA